MKKFMLTLILCIAPFISAIEFDIDDYFPMSITTSQFSTGALFTSAPTYIVYEMVNSTGAISTTEIITSTALTADFDAKTGLHVGSFQLTTAAGFDAGNAYIVFFQATVDSVAGGFSETFKIQPAIVATSAAQTTAQNDLDIITGSDGTTLATTQANYAPNKTVPLAAATDQAEHDSTQASLATAQLDLDTITGTAGVKVDDGTGPGQIALTNGAIDQTNSLLGHVNQTGDSFPRIGVAGAGLTNINLPNQTMDITGSLSGSVGTVTLVSANGITATSIATDAIDADAWATDATTEIFNTNTGTLSVGAPPSNPTFVEVYTYLYYDLFFAKHEQTAILDTVFQSGGTIPAYDRVVGDAAGTTTKDQVGAVP